MSHKYTLIKILLVSSMKSACYITHTLTIPGGVGGGGYGVIPSHFISVNVKHTTGPIKINIQNFDITDLSYRGRC